jgi:drug/metabolite transporter (DMT)-like permease
MAGQLATGMRDQPLTAIALKTMSVAIFVAMQTFIKAAGDVPAGEIVFFRSFFAVFPLLAFMAWHKELATAWKTQRPLGHFWRGFVGTLAMALGFFALTRLPLPEAIVLNYAQPLLVVVFSALFLGENVRLYRWSAVVIGLIGVIIVGWPKMTVVGDGMGDREFVGVLAAFGAAAMSAVAMLLIRNLVGTEKSATIVLWFSLSASGLALLSLPFGWTWLTPQQTMLLVLAGFCGGIAQIFMTEAYRYGEASTVAPFEYASLILGILVGFFVFREVPTVHMIVGGLIVVGSGLFIVWRERRLGLDRAAARKVAPPQ